MPAPPILDIYVVWHPSDAAGADVFDRLHGHFHGAGYAGLAGGAIEVYARSLGWETASGPPRELRLPRDGGAPLAAPQFTAIVPVLGGGMRRAVRSDPEWAAYLKAIQESVCPEVSVLPVRIPAVNLEDSELEAIMGALQALPLAALGEVGLLERSVAQAVSQSAAGTTEAVKVFVSHTKRMSGAEFDVHGPALFEEVRAVIAQTHLGEFFDAHDLLPGVDWAAELDANAGSSALLMVRTDLYASREWTQREVLAAKERDVPIVGLMALSEGEARGSFLMDHVPTVPLCGAEVRSAIATALNRLVDEVLKRALWLAQSTYISAEGFDWTPVHAPEPVTALRWLRDHRSLVSDDQHLWIIHPDPPLGPPERAVIDSLCQLAGFDGRVDILTPRTFAARGGVLDD